jgi:hypothetical protein
MASSTVISDAELKEAERRVGAHGRGSSSPKDYTCFGCSGRKMIAECSDEERAQWQMLRRFNPGALTLCSLAWDPYNTNGDCLAEK